MGVPISLAGFWAMLFEKRLDRMPAVLLMQEIVWGFGFTLKKI